MLSRFSVGRHWGLRRLLDPAPLQGARGPAGDPQLIAVVATAELILLAFALAPYFVKLGT